MRTQIQVEFEYEDFDESTKKAQAVVYQEGEWFWAVNLAQFGYGRRVSSVVSWHPIKAALSALIGGRTVNTWKELS